MRARAVTRHARPYVLKFTRRRARRACSPRPVGAYGRGRTGHCRISRHLAPATRLDERTGAFSALLPRTSSAPRHLHSSTASPPPSLCPRLLHVHCVHCVLRRHHGLSASLTLSSFTTRALRALCAVAASWPLRLLRSVLFFSFFHSCRTARSHNTYDTPPPPPKAR